MRRTVCLLAFTFVAAAQVNGPSIPCSEMRIVHLPPAPEAPTRQLDCDSIPIPPNITPTMVATIMLGGVAVPCYAVMENGRYVRQTFTADDNWLDHLTITFLNRTNKTIDYLSVNFGLRQTARPGGLCGMSLTSAYTVSLGRSPANAPKGWAGNPNRPPLPADWKDGQPPWRKPLGWQAGNTITISLADFQDHPPEEPTTVTHAARIRRELEQILGPGKSVTEMTIHPLMVTFSDGMQWGGRYRSPAPDFTMLPADYFPGDVNTPWLPK